VRADRLLAVLFLLQARGRVTAAEVAAELEISERTARRDLEALGLAGVPVFSRQGRHGGWELVGGARTDLSGLTAAEARALFLVAGPSSEATPEVKAALRKLVQALPEPFRREAEAASRAVVVDASGWGGVHASVPPPRFLDEVQRSVIDGEQARLGYVARDGTATERVVHPLGLAAKGRVWYLLAGTDAGLRTFRVERIVSWDPTGPPAVRPPDFDLADAWRSVTTELDQRWSAVRALGWAEPGTVPLLRGLFRERVALGPPGDDGRVAIEVTGPAERALAGELAGLGAGIEIVAPPVVRDHLARIGAELTSTYRPRAAEPGPSTRRGRRATE